MKTLKKYLKVVLCFMAFAVASFAFAFSPISPAFAAEASFAATMAITKMPTKVDAQNEDLKIPYVSGAEIRVYDASGKEHKYTGTDDDYFTKDGSVVKVAKEKLIGSSNPYRIVYVKGEFYSKEYKVYVSDASYTLKLVEENNSRVLIPSKIAKNADARVALPTRAEINDEEHTSDVTVEVRKDGHAVANYTLGTSPAENTYVVEGKFVPKETGEYTISYYANKCDVVKYSFEVEDGYVAPAAEDITFETPKVSGIELGKKEIPVVSNYQAERPLKITDKKGNDVAYNLKSIEIVNAGNENIKATLGYNTYVFDMTTTAFGATAYRDMVGTYNFVFTVEDVYGHTLTKTVEVKNVTDSTSPKVKMAYNYTVDADQEVVGEVNTNVEADFKASVGYKELVLPAVYAEDYVSTNSDMKYVRF
ncbi:MAG: hypothetical protein MJ149_03315, partial [Clostridia bacterium]|nr:hypothetical protein [Clostridia bacterium]